MYLGVYRDPFLSDFTAKFRIILILNKHFPETIWIAKLLILRKLWRCIQTLWMLFGNLWITCCQPLDGSRFRASKLAPIFGWSRPKVHKKMDGPFRNPSIKTCAPYRGSSFFSSCFTRQRPIGARTSRPVLRH